MKVSTVIVGALAGLTLMAAGLKGVVFAGTTTRGETNFVVIFDGEIKRVAETSAQTVAEAVRAFRIDLAAGDVVEPGLMTEITEGPFYINIQRARLSAEVGELLRTGRSPLDNRVRVELMAWAPLPVEELPKQTVVNAVAQVFSAGPTFGATPQKVEWLTAAGVPEADWGYADFIIFKESSWNPDAVNRRSGACGLVQALPCSKLGENWNDPVTAIRWQYNYVTKRYGGYAGAYRFWQTHKWY